MSSGASIKSSVGGNSHRSSALQGEYAALVPSFQIPALLAWGTEHLCWQSAEATMSGLDGSAFGGYQCYAGVVIIKAKGPGNNEKSYGYKVAMMLPKFYQNFFRRLNLMMSR